MKNKFTAVINNVKYNAYVISNFSILGDNYCVFAVDNAKDVNTVYCNKIVNDNLIEIESEEERKLVSKVVNTILDAVKGRDVNG